MTNWRATLALTAYIATIVGANWLTARYGLIPVLPGLAVTAGTYAAGLALLARDVVQDTAGRMAAIAAIGAGAAASWWLSTPTLALASGAAFLLAETTDFAVYTPFRTRGWGRAVVASNAVGALVDTFVFLSLAGFPVIASTVGGQLIGKVLWATCMPVLAITAVRRIHARVTA